MADSVYAVLSVEGPNLSRKIDISLGETTIGRQSSNEVHIPSPLVSRQHARIHCDQSGCLLEDLGSSNGTVLNGVPLEAEVRSPLKDGDVIEIGPFHMTIELVKGEEPEAVEAPEPEAELPVEDELTERYDEPGESIVEQAPPPAEEPEPPARKEQPPARPARTRAPEPPRARSASGAPPSANGFGEPDALPPIPPGLDRYSRRYLEYLPPIYHTDFMSRFLALFESILMPVEWTVDSFDMFLDPRTAPAGFLPWLQNWFLAAFDDTWSEEKRRTFLLEAHMIYARRGTKWALARILEIYLGHRPEIEDDSPQLEPLTFVVRIPMAESTVDRELVENLIDLNKPAHTTYQLTFRR